MRAFFVIGLLVLTALVCVLWMRLCIRGFLAAWRGDEREG